MQRYRGLYAEDSICQADLDTAEALVSQYQGTVKTNQAAANDAKLNLDLPRFAHRSVVVCLRQLDRRQPGSGQRCHGAGGDHQVTEPIVVSFTLPENNLALVLERYRSGAKMPVQAWNRGDTKELAVGGVELSTIRLISPPAP